MAYSQVVKIDGDVANPIPVTGIVVATPSGTQNVRQYFGTDSLANAGSAATPTTGQAIVTIPTPPAGFYEIEVNRIAGGSGTPTLFNNGEFRVGAAAYTLMSAAVLEIPYKYMFYMDLNGSESLSVNQVANASSGITIAASIIATRLA